MASAILENILPWSLCYNRGLVMIGGVGHRESFMNKIFIFQEKCKKFPIMVVDFVLDLVNEALRCLVICVYFLLYVLAGILLQMDLHLVGSAFLMASPTVTLSVIVFKYKLISSYYLFFAFFSPVINLLYPTFKELVLRSIIFHFKNKETLKGVYTVLILFLTFFKSINKDSFLEEKGFILLAVLGLLLFSLSFIDMGISEPPGFFKRMIHRLLSSSDKNIHIYYRIVSSKYGRFVKCNDLFNYNDSFQTTVKGFLVKSEVDLNLIDSPILFWENNVKCFKLSDLTEVVLLINQNVGERSSSLTMKIVGNTVSSICSVAKNNRIMNLVRCFEWLKENPSVGINKGGFLESMLVEHCLSLESIFELVIEGDHVLKVNSVVNGIYQNWGAQLNKNALVEVYGYSSSAVDKIFEHCNLFFKNSDIDDCTNIATQLLINRFPKGGSVVGSSSFKKYCSDLNYLIQKIYRLRKYIKTVKDLKPTELVCRIIYETQRNGERKTETLKRMAGGIKKAAIENKKVNFIRSEMYGLLKTEKGNRDIDENRGNKFKLLEGVWGKEIKASNNLIKEMKGKEEMKEKEDRRVGAPKPVKLSENLSNEIKKSFKEIIQSKSLFNNLEPRKLLEEPKARKVTKMLTKTLTPEEFFEKTKDNKDFVVGQGSENSKRTKKLLEKREKALRHLKVKSLNEKGEYDICKLRNNIMKVGEGLELNLDTRVKVEVEEIDMGRLKIVRENNAEIERSNKIKEENFKKLNQFKNTLEGFVSVLKKGKKTVKEDMTGNNNFIELINRFSVLSDINPENEEIKNYIGMSKIDGVRSCVKETKNEEFKREDVISGSAISDLKLFKDETLIKVGCNLLGKNKLKNCFKKVSGGKVKKVKGVSSSPGEAILNLIKVPWGFKTTVSNKIIAKEVSKSLNIDESRLIKTDDIGGQKAIIELNRIARRIKEVRRAFNRHREIVNLKNKGGSKSEEVDIDGRKSILDENEKEEWLNIYEEITKGYLLCNKEIVDSLNKSLLFLFKNN